LRRLSSDVSSAIPRIYDAVQRFCGLGHTRRRLRPLLADTAGRVVLDVGADTDLVVPLLPPSSRYLWLDNDLDKLRGARTAGCAGSSATRPSCGSAAAAWTSRSAWR